jgi:hypothetical protein
MIAFNPFLDDLHIIPPLSLGAEVCLHPVEPGLACDCFAQQITAEVMLSISGLRLQSLRGLAVATFSLESLYKKSK